jgi:hypothetical protein
MSSELYDPKSDTREWRTRDTIPADLMCVEPYCEGGPFKDQRAFMGHMYAKHRIRYSDAKGKHVNQVGLEKARKLLPWHRMMIARKVVYGHSHADLAEEFKKKPQTIANILDWESANVEMLIESQQLEAFGDAMLAREWAKENRDYDALHRMNKDIGLHKILTKNDKSAPTAIVINMPSADAMDMYNAPTPTYTIISDEEDSDE